MILSIRVSQNLYGTENNHRQYCGLNHSLILSLKIHLVDMQMVLEEAQSAYMDQN